LDVYTIDTRNDGCLSSVIMGTQHITFPLSWTGKKLHKLGSRITPIHWLLGHCLFRLVKCLLRIIRAFATVSPSGVVGVLGCMSQMCYVQGICMSICGPDMA
jgi:hypothetical protein